MDWGGFVSDSDLFGLDGSDLVGPDRPPQARGDDYDQWAQTVIRRAAPDYLLADKRAVTHVMGRLRIELAAALRSAYEMGVKGTPLGIVEERGP